MSRYWDSIFKLDDELSIWVDEEDLGKEIILFHNSKRINVKIPQEINKGITICYKGLGKTRMHKTGDFILHVWLNKGEDIRKNLWLSETSARNGAEKKLYTGERTIIVLIPPNSYHGLTIRLKNLGKRPGYGPFTTYLNQKKRGNLLVKLCVYPDHITPKYGSFDALTTDNMVLEGWVYRKFDEVLNKIVWINIPIQPIQAEDIADRFNEGGYFYILNSLIDHLKIGHLNIELIPSNSISLPGSCEKLPITDNNNRIIGQKYQIQINNQFLDNPFFIAAILSHELCHIVYLDKIGDIYMPIGPDIDNKAAILEVERTVDLLVFMFKLGEFQLRVARDKRLVLGYFNQEVFERMQVIVSKKINSK